MWMDQWKTAGISCGQVWLVYNRKEENRTFEKEREVQGETGEKNQELSSISSTMWKKKKLLVHSG